MADPRAELEELRRLDELEKRAFPSPQMQKLQMPKFNVTGDVNADKEAFAKFIGTPGLNASERDAAHKKMLSSYGWGSGIPKLAYDIGGDVTDAVRSVSGNRSLLNPAGINIPPEVAAGVGGGANVMTQALPSFLSSFRIPGAVEQSLLQKPAERLMQSAVKPSMADRDSGKAAQAIKTMLEEGISPTAGGMDKTSNLVRGLNEQVQSTLESSPGMVSAIDVGKRLQPVYDKARMQVDPHADMRAVEGAWDAFKRSPVVREQAALGQQFGPVPSIHGDVSIPVKLANELKQGTYRSLGDKAYGELGSASGESQKALARGLRETIAEAEPGVVEALKREASLMNVKNVAGNAVTRDANKDIIGLAGAASNPVAGAAMLADRWGALKAMLARGLYTSGKPSVALPIGISADEAMQTDNQRMAEYLRKRAAEQGAQ